MDNIAQQIRDTESSRIIRLNPSQYSFYQDSSIEICDPDGKFLEQIGNFVQRSQDEENLLHLKELVYLLQALCCNIDQSVELPPQAIAGLADVFWRMQKHF
jgi:hypothetical protein